MHQHPTRRLNPAKLLCSKWTAANLRDRERHFIVTKAIAPVPPAVLIDTIEIEAVLSRRAVCVPWRTLLDSAQWLQGWQ